MNNYKGALQEWTMSAGLPLPSYATTQSAAGFVCRVTVYDAAYRQSVSAMGETKRPTKKRAEHDAARVAMEAWGITQDAAVHSSALPWTPVTSIFQR
jgi:dsRNA-specific ribonuclease